MSDAEWTSLAVAAHAIGVSESTAYRQTRDPAKADKMWGVGNWRLRPFITRPVYQVRTARLAELAKQAGRPWPPESG